jgi:very-short-patch-repair endonuclease
MSPVSVSTFLKPGALEFDLVVFDEASQLPTQEAIPSILRAKQVVVAGDENQLPPTSFFMVSSIFEDEDEDSDDEFVPLESLLNECAAVKPIFQDANIVWHYRSKDERLIKFSNYNFYNNSLITFPSTTQSTEGRGVHLIYTDGTWDKGKSRTNRIEAIKTAEAVIEQFKKYPDRSVGVVAMNASQKEAIEYAIDEMITDKPNLLPFMDPNNPEPFFVKSLENVQGDERDTIIISIGYAKTVEGSLSLNFGPLNRDGGWRRLNVLVTRAKWQTILVTSLKSHELGAINPNNKGALMLRNFIEYAERGCQLPPDLAIPTGEETNDFENAVAAALRDCRIEVDEQVGASGYRIDLAIRDPRDINRYIMAVECDGATYHSGRTARDRDILRQEVLKSQGWKIYRLWSTDWFRDREKTLQGILDAIEIAKKFPSQESMQAIAKEKIDYSKDDEQDILSKTIATKPLIKKKFNPGQPYQKYLVYRKRDSRILLNKANEAKLALAIDDIVKQESPIHLDVLTDRLKEYFGVSKAGNNIRLNVANALKTAKDYYNYKSDHLFIYKNTSRPSGFRLPSIGAMRDLSHIAPEEIENAVLFLVEDQFGFAREHISKAILEIFGLGKTRTESTKKIESAVDRLIMQGKLRLNGYTLYIT